MGWFFSGLISSVGFKRTIAAVFAALYGIVSAVPTLQPFTTVLEQLAALFGITGLAQASVSGTLSKVKLSTISSFLSVLLLLAQYIPAMQPFAPMLFKLASIIGAMGAGATVGSAVTKASDKALADKQNY